MAENYAARKEGQYKIVGLAPDVCFTPGMSNPVPYPVISTLAPAKNTVDSVLFNGNPAFVHDGSFSPVTIGDAAGSNKGVVSGTVEGDCWSIEHSPDTWVGGLPLNRVQDLFAMNGKAMGGRGGNLTKKEAWERRKQLIAKGKQSSNPKVRAAAERLDLNNTGIEKARLAQHIYEPDNPTKQKISVPEGWKDISHDQGALSKYGLKEEDLESVESQGFKARVYEPEETIFGNDMSGSVVFRGTRIKEWEDWKNNAKQAYGFQSPYYKQAVSIGSKLQLNNVKIDCTGHSLGGGLASACSRASGKPGWTYNAAGLNKKTVKKYGGREPVLGSEQENIIAYRVKGEALTSIQEPGFWGGAGIMLVSSMAGAGLLGLKLVNAPVAVGTHHDLEGGTGNMVDKHGMDQVIRCIEQEKATDEALLAAQ
ncbi:PAAR-like domain-containing protein [Mixta calida]|uniref:PAAR-like domain-containing protein n=1 Tax=Mixta calida TaxID=665913 RepID=UPI0034D4DE64